MGVDRGVRELVGVLGGESGPTLLLNDVDENEPRRDE